MIGDILQPTHLLFVLVVALIVLGPKRLPEVGRALGRGLRDFRNAINTDDLREQMVSSTSTETTTPVAQEPTEPTETLTHSHGAPSAPGSEAPAPAPGDARAEPGGAETPRAPTAAAPASHQIS